MGFVDPLFVSSLFGILGIIGAYNVGVPVHWLISEAIFTLGNICLLVRDWNSYITKEEKGRIGSFKIYFFYVCISAVLMLLAMSTGLRGDSRLGTSAVRKFIDVSSAIILPGSTLLYQMVNTYIPRKQVYVFAAGLSLPVILGTSKSSGLLTLLWATQRWVNPKSGFFLLQKIREWKIRPIPIVVIAILVIAIMISISSLVGGISLLELISYILLRFSRNLDFYIFASQLDQGKWSEIFAESGGWIGNIFGNLSGYTHNIGALLKAAALHTDPNATGSNPRLHGLIIIQLNNTDMALLASIFIVVIELWIISKKREQMLKLGLSNSGGVYGFIMWTTAVLSFHTDVGTLKYSLIAMLSGHFVLKARKK